MSGLSCVLDKGAPLSESCIPESSTGYKLANDGQDTRSLAHYLGHRSLQINSKIYSVGA
jgi:hypothetical protein